MHSPMQPPIRRPRSRPPYGVLAIAGLALGCATVLATGGRPVRVYLAGDSTMAEKLAEKRPETGWGERLGEYFRADEVVVVNRARNGRSTRTFLSEGLWHSIADSLLPGDWVLIEFGHNDSSKDKPDRYTTPAEYRANLLRFVAETRGKGATPLLLTPVPRRKFDRGGALVDTHGEYPDIVRDVATREGVPLVDMQALGAGALRALGPDSSRRLFLQLPPGAHPNYPAGISDDTHFSPEGAALMASLFVGRLRELQLPLGTRLRR
jgi:lysophospholipase L1-like esterase